MSNLLYVSVGWFLCGLLLPAGQAKSQIVDSLAVTGTGLDIDISGNVFVVDMDRNVLTVSSRGTPGTSRSIGGQGWGQEQFDGPNSVWARNGLDIFVADYGNHRIQRFDRTLSFVSSLFTRDDEDPGRRFGYPTDMTLTRQGDLFICDSENARILKVARSTIVDRTFGGYEAGKGRLFAPRRIEAGPNDFLYVLDRERVMVFDSFGNFIHELGAGMFQRPAQLYADPDRVIVLDGDRLYRFDDRERPLEPLAVSALTGRRFEGAAVRSIGLRGSTLAFLTAQGVFFVPMPESGQKGPRED